MGEWKPLTPSDVKAFDDFSTDLILEMTEHGWVGRISSKGHAILRAPDSDTTHAVSRDSLRGRSGRNSRAVFTRWLSGQNMNPGEEWAEFTCKQCGDSFVTARALGAHRKKHLPGIKCSECGKEVKYLAKHMKVHEKVDTKSLSERLLELAAEVERLERNVKGTS